MGYLLIASGQLYPNYRMDENKVYYGFINVDGELKIKKFNSKNSREIKSKMFRQETISELFAGYFKHF